MLLFCVKIIVKEGRNFELAHLKKKKKEEREHFGAFGDFLVQLPQCFFMPLVVLQLLVMKHSF